MEPKYPKQIKRITNGTLFFYAEADFVVIPDTDLQSQSLLDIDAASKIGLYIFDSERQESVKYNIEAELSRYILEKSVWCLQNDIQKNVKKPGQEKANASLAYSVRLKGGRLSGKTPAEVLLEAADGLPANMNLLAQQYQYLGEHMQGKFAEANKQQMLAIQDAVQLYQSGQLSAENLTGSAISIYTGMKTPNVKKVDTRGLTQARTLSISYVSGEKEPFQVQIMNCMAPPTGTLVGAKLGQAEEKKTMTMKVTEESWYIFWQAVCQRLSDFERCVVPRHFSLYQQHKDSWKRNYPTTNYY